jgi:hypothetical protein
MCGDWNTTVPESEEPSWSRQRGFSNHPRLNFAYCFGHSHVVVNAAFWREAADFPGQICGILSVDILYKLVIMKNTHSVELIVSTLEVEIWG